MTCINSTNKVVMNLDQSSLCGMVFTISCLDRREQPMSVGMICDPTVDEMLEYLGNEAEVRYWAV